MGPRKPGHLGAGSQGAEAPTARRMLASVVAVMTSTSLPVFLVGSLEVEMRSSLSMDVARFGVALAIYYLVASVTSVPGSRLSERIGGDRSLRTAAALSALALLSIAGAVNDWSELVPALMVAGFAASPAQPSANLLLAESSPKTRQGIAFGVKQSAAPLAALPSRSSRLVSDGVGHSPRQRRSRPSVPSPCPVYLADRTLLEQPQGRRGRA